MALASNYLDRPLGGWPLDRPASVSDIGDIGGRQRLAVVPPASAACNKRALVLGWGRNQVPYMAIAREHRSFLVGRSIFA